MSDNLATWNALFKTDPAHVKPITGKSYSGNSPKPQYIIMRLTEQFGPVGTGFGWTVVHEAYVDGIPRVDGTEKMHECRIRFWAKSPDCAVDSYGCTKALYKAKVGPNGEGGYWLSDEDAAKKSLTDAIVKAASWLGCAGDIFMGRWDDSKYQAELREEFGPKRAKPTVEAQREAFRGSLETPHDPETGEVRQPMNVAQAASQGLHDAWLDGIRDSLPENAPPPVFYAAIADALIGAFNKLKSQKGVSAQWDKRDGLIMEMQELAPKEYHRTLEAFNDRMAALREPTADEYMRAG
jgi:hypothetical protein